MAAATVILSGQSFRPAGVDAHLSIPDAAHGQNVEGDYDVEMMMLDGYVSHKKFFKLVLFVDLFFVHQELASSPDQMDTRSFENLSCWSAENNRLYSNARNIEYPGNMRFSNLVTLGINLCEGSTKLIQVF
jgi:hypothetical protein